MPRPCLMIKITRGGRAMRRLAAVILAGGLLLAVLPPAAGAAGTIPAAAKTYRALLVREARLAWGINAPVATFAAQIHAESAWDIHAVSPAGAQGLAQFMPSTAAWISAIFPDLRTGTLGMGTGREGTPSLPHEDAEKGEAPLPFPKPEKGEAPFSPHWAVRAMLRYDDWLFARVTARSACERMAFALCAYNGGLGWVQRDKRLARNKGIDPEQYWGGVETVNAGRSAANFRENRDYPRRILLRLEPVYEAAGWGGGLCP